MIVALGDASQDKLGIRTVRACEGNILGVARRSNVYGEFMTLEIAQEDGIFLGVVITHGMEDLKTYTEALVGIDVAPFVRLEYIGVTEAVGRYKVKRIAWEFVPSKDKPKSQTYPKSLETFGSREGDDER